MAVNCIPLILMGLYRTVGHIVVLYNIYDYYFKCILEYIIGTIIILLRSIETTNKYKFPFCRTRSDSMDAIK